MNTDGRRKAVRIHDLHHVVTGYQTDLRGECEIAAWELASGCRRMPAAFILNLAALALGTVVAPVRCARAWARGRQTRNLYPEDTVEHLLPRRVQEVRTALRLDQPSPPVRVRDVVALMLAALPPLVLLATLVLAPVLVLALLVA